MPNYPKSTTHKTLRGTYRDDRTKRINPETIPESCPEPPETLSQGALVEWLALAPTAWEQGTLVDADLRAFSLLCEVLATETSARELIVQEGTTIDAGSGGKKAHPALKQMETARSQATRLLESFGLTPRSRTNVEIKPPKKESSIYDHLEDDFRTL